MLCESDPHSAKEQLDESYSFAGGWRKFEGFVMNEKGDILYPGDPPIPALAECLLHDEEVIRLYVHSWVAIIQPSGEFEVARMY
jgi:hypothetical protein